MSLFATKSIDRLRAEGAGRRRAGAEAHPHSATDLTTLGIGAIIGTGIFVLTGRAAAAHAGPAIVLSHGAGRGLASALAGLCYAEFASMVPIAGSAYTYGTRRWANSSPGSSAGTSFSSTRSARPRSRSGGREYVISFLHVVGIQFPARERGRRFQVITLADGSAVTAVFNLPAVLITRARHCAARRRHRRNRRGSTPSSSSSRSRSCCW